MRNAASPPQLDIVGWRRSTPSSIFFPLSPIVVRPGTGFDRSTYYAGGRTTSLLVVAVALVLFAPITGAQAAGPETQVSQTVQAFYDAFNSHRFDRVAEITTDDWNHINPLGGRTRGRAQVLAELRKVHGTFLKNVTDRIEHMDVRFASDDVAVATVSSRVSTFTTPDGKRYENEQLTHTFVVVRRGDRWLIMQDHDTIVSPVGGGTR